VDAAKCLLGRLDAPGNSALPLVNRFLKALHELSQAGLAQLVQLGQTLASWSVEIARMWRFTKNNGITEGSCRHDILGLASISMQVSKWGNSLAIRLPQAVVEALQLKEGDEIEISVAGAREFAVDRDRRRERALEILRNSNWKFPAGWKFDREAANQREDGQETEDGKGIEDGHSYRSSPRGRRRAG
jgi:antitoxin MazE